MSRSIESIRRKLRRMPLPYQPPLLLWTLTFTVGALLALLGADLWVAVLATALSALVAFGSAVGSPSGLRFRRLSIAMILIAPTLIAAGFWRAESTSLEADSIAWIDLAEQPVELQGVVVDDPEFRSGGVRLTLDAGSVALGPERREVDDRVVVQFADPVQLQRGDNIRFRATVAPVSAGRDDYFQWLANQGVAALATGSGGSIEILAQQQMSWWQDVAARTRHALNDSLRASLPPPLSGIAQGMITGRRGAIDPELRTDLNHTSLSHLIVISGSNLTILTTIVMTAFAWLVGRRGAALLAIAAALTYGTLIGPDPPVQRAMWMAIVFAAAHLLGRGSSALHAVAIAAGLMIALEPRILLDLSFQLTLAGTLSIVLLMPVVSRGFLSGEQGIAASLRDAALMTFVAGLATMPLIIVNFGHAALIGLPANLLVAPLFSWMLLGSAATAVIGLISEPLSIALGWPLAWLPLRWLTIVAEQSAQIPGAGVPIHGFNHWHLLIIYAAMFVAAWRPHRERVTRWNRQTPASNPSAGHRGKRSIPVRFIPGLRSHLTPVLLTAGAAALAGVLWISVVSETDNRLRVHFLDVGQGDATLLVTPEHRSVLIDTGDRSDAVLAALRTHLPEDTRTIDLVVITHPQTDHGAALWAILEHYEIGQLLVSRYVESTRFGRQIVELAAERRIPLVTAQSGQRMLVDGRVDLTLDVLWPPADGLPEAYLSDPNATSIVLRARFGDAAFLFTGDINARQELDLAQHPCASAARPCRLAADVIKVAHQGSRFSSTSLFLQAVRPTLAVISAGAGNPHGHPHEEAIANLRRVGAMPLVTSWNGDVSVSTDGHSISVTTER